MTTTIRASCEMIIRNLSRFIHQEDTRRFIHQKDIAIIIANIYKHPDARPVPGSKALFVCEIDNKLVFFVDKNSQGKINFEYDRSWILSYLELNPDTKILQVIGDCIPFSNRGTQKAKDKLSLILEEPNQLLIWGYTGSQQDDGRRMDINQIINTWIDESPIRANRVLANVLDLDTPRALKEWNCFGSKNTKNFYLVNGEAKFGEDIVSSDFLTDRSCCFEGGIESFRQMIDLLARDINIRCYYGLRNEENTVGNTYFSAVQFVKFIRESIEEYYKYNNLTPGEIPEKMQVADEFLELWKRTYLEKHLLCNPQVKDASSRKALFETAWELFLKKELWKKLYLCEFVSCLIE